MSGKTCLQKSLRSVPKRGHGAWRYMAVLVLGADLIASERAPNVAIVAPLPASLQPHWAAPLFHFVPASLAVVAHSYVSRHLVSAPQPAGASTNGQQGGDESYFTERSDTIVQLMPKHSSPTLRTLNKNFNTVKGCQRTPSSCLATWTAGPKQAARMNHGLGV